MALVGLREEFGFDHASPVGQRKEFHRFARDLVMGALLHDKTAGDNRFTDEFAEAIDGAIGVPRHAGEQFERMAADSKAE